MNWSEKEFAEYLKKPCERILAERKKVRKGINESSIITAIGTYLGMLKNIHKMERETIIE
jgi:cytochrome c2